MKRIMYLTAVLIIICAAAAYAGVWSTVTGYVEGQALNILIGGIIGALGMFGLTYKLWGIVTKEALEFIVAIIKAVRPSSPGGKQITQDEMQRIINEGMDVYPALKNALAAKVKKNG